MAFADLHKSKVDVVLSQGIHKALYSFSLDVAERLKGVEDKADVVTVLPVHVT